MLTEFITTLDSNLTSQQDWRPFPTVDDRAAWNALPPEVRSTQVAQGEAALGYAWPALPATLFLEYARDGNRSKYQDVRNARRYALRDLVVAECLEGRGRFLDDIVNGIWATCEETYWGVPAHVGVQQAGIGLPDVEEPTVDLFAAETVALLAWTNYLLGAKLDSVSPLVRPRIVYEAKRRILDPCWNRDDFWWMSFHPGAHSVNNWNPWVNSNWLTAVLHLEQDHAKRVAAISKIIRSLDIFIDHYAESGGCDEGPGYWGRAAASLFDCLELLYSATNGAIDLYEVPKIRNMGSFILRTHIHEHYFVNFADASAIVEPAATLVYRYGKRCHDDAMVSFGAWLATRQNGGGWEERESIGRKLPALFSLAEIKSIRAEQPMPRDAWYDGIQVMVARHTAGSAQGLFISAKGGHNAESHNHNDIGNFILYVDGKPVVVDAGVETYTRKTFSPSRYEIWTMQSAYHTLLPTIDGVMQSSGRVFAARDVDYLADDVMAQLRLDIAGAYPPEACLTSWMRTITLYRGQELRVEDTFELAQAVQEISLSLLTPCAPVQIDAGVLVLDARAFSADNRSGRATVTYDPSAFTVEFEQVPISDDRLGGVWGAYLNRVVLKAVHPPQQGDWLVRFSA